MPISKIKTNSISDDAVTTPKMADSFFDSGQNIIVNGAMNVSQRATQVTGLGASNDVFAALDRIKYFVGNTAGRFTAEQVAVTDLPGFANAMKLSCTTSDTSIAADEFLGFKHMIEGQDVQQLKKGTSEAESTTLSFYVKGNAAAEYTVEIRDMDNDRINTQVFNVTDSWTRVEMTFAADTTGAYDDDNAMSLQMSWWLHAGSTYNSGTFASNTWASRVQGNRVKSSNSSFFDSTSRTLFVTGIQYEVGQQATPFKHEDYGTTLARCQRYYCHAGFNGGTPYGGAGIAMYALSANEAGGTVVFPVTMRDGPTIRTKNAAGTIGGIHRAAVGDVASGVSIQWGGNAESNKVGFSGLTKTSGWATGNMLIGAWEASAEL